METSSSNRLRRPTIFLSYSSMDGLLAEELARQLKVHGFEVWYDRNLVEPGEPVRDVLMAKLREADVVLCLLSESSVRSANVMSELGVALQLESDNPEKMLLGVMIGKVQTPYNIADRRGIYLDPEDVRTLPSPGFNRALDEIHEAIDTFIERLPNAAYTSAGAGGAGFGDSSPAPQPTDSPDIHFWMMGLDQSDWDLPDLPPRMIEVVEARGNKLPEWINNIDDVQEGDRVLVYVRAQESFRFDMVIEERVQVFEKERAGYIIRIELAAIEKLNTPLSLSQAFSVIPEKAEWVIMDFIPSPRMIQISEEEYYRLLEMSGSVIREKYLPHYESEGQFGQTEDHLGFTPDIESFASVITLESVMPPLAIGLFGNWGTGKSFFMKKLEGRIRTIADEQRAGYVKKVVPVWFNSWHYSDTNLWASLAAHIFERLHAFAVDTGQKAGYQKIAEQLQFTQVQLDAVEQKLAEQEHKIADADQRATDIDKEIKYKKETLDFWKLNQLFKVAWRSPRVRDEVQRMNEQIGMGRAVESYEQAEQELERVRGLVGRIREAFLQMSRFASWRWAVIAVITVLLVAGFRYLTFYKKEELSWLVDGIKGYIVTAIAWLATVTAILEPFLRKVNKWKARLLKLKTHIEEEREKALRLEYDLKAKMQEELESLRQQRDALISEKRRAEETKKRLKQSMSDLITGKAMTEFLLQRSSDDSYASQLGIISLIRKDFQRLDDLLAQQREARLKEGAKPDEGIWIDRIVLYIDDLDRCSETTVVKVLEAIHLLLAFPLFVVVVGVDPRWLDNALNLQLGKLFKGEEEKSNSASVTSYDYLEKIFQVPFTLKPMTKRSKSDLLAYLVREDLKLAPGHSDAVSAVASDATAPGKTDAEESMNPIRNSTTNPAKTRKPLPDVASGIQLAPGRLVITPAELEFMQQVAPLFGRSARAMHRYVNIYRLIKAHGDLAAPQGYSDRVYRPILLLLGLIMNPSENVEAFLQHLREAQPAYRFRDFWTAAYAEERFQTFCSRLEPLLPDVGNLRVSDFQANLDLVSRFCFRLHPVAE